MSCVENAIHILTQYTQFISAVQVHLKTESILTDTIRTILVTDQALSGHSSITFTLHTSRTPRPVKTVSFRSFKPLDKEVFKVDLLSSSLFTHSSQCPADLLEDFNRVMTDLLDKHAPWKHRSLTIRPYAPWYTADVQKLRTEKRRAEKKWSKTGLEEHRDAFIEARSRVSNTIKIAKKDSI